MVMRVLAPESQDPRTLANEQHQQRAPEGTGGGPANAVSEEVSPMVKVILPEPNSSVTNPVAITASVESAQEITRVEFWKDNDKEPFHVLTIAPYETSVTLESGRHRVNVAAYDESQNIKRSQEVAFTVQ